MHTENFTKTGIFSSYNTENVTKTEILLKYGICGKDKNRTKIRKMENVNCIDENIVKRQKTLEKWKSY